jgi:hypothetical protein
MTLKISIVVLVCGLVLLGIGCNPANQTATTNTTNVKNNTNAVPEPAALTCTATASATWVSSPSIPSEIPGNGTNICQFHEFSWQAFIALMNNQPSGNKRVFQSSKDYPLLVKTKNSCAETGVESQIFIRSGKNSDLDGSEFVLPKDIGQAQDSDTIYDQNGNVVFYEVRFSRNECSQNPNGQGNFVAGTTELKVSYRVIKDADKPNYIWMNADINGDGKILESELLGMVGFHLVTSTPLHPEFVWATFEHKSNAPDCQTPVKDPNGWSFTSAACASQLPNSVVPTTCDFNTAKAATALSGGKPTEICRAYHASSKPGDNQYDTNVLAIDTLNTQLTGASGFITALPAASSLAVLKNYQLVGALWVTDITKPSSDITNQRGSIQLANTTMETTDQMTDPQFTPVAYTGTSNLKNATNCFACHGYTPGNNVAESHIFTKIFGPTPTPTPTATLH